VVLFCSTFIAFSLENFSSLLPVSLKWWVTVVLYRPLPWWVVPELNDQIAVGASKTLAWFTVPHLGCPPNGGLTRFILDESHQKGSDYVSLPVNSCLLIQHYSCSCSDCTGFHTLKPYVIRRSLYTIAHPQTCQSIMDLSMLSRLPTLYVHAHNEPGSTLRSLLLEVTKVCRLQIWQGNSNCCITDRPNLFKWQLLCWYTSAIGRANLIFKMMPQVLLSPCE